MWIIDDPHWLLLFLLLSIAGICVAWALLLFLPYALLSEDVPAGKMGLSIGHLQLIHGDPQLISAALLGPVLTFFFHDQLIWAQITEDVSLFFPGPCTLRQRSPKI
ncbi:MAG: hypothetical protein ABI767_02305 [Rhodanobacter sp.]